MHNVQTSTFNSAKTLPPDARTDVDTTCMLPLTARVLNALSWWLTISVLALIRYPLVWLVNFHDWLVTKHNLRVDRTRVKYKLFCSGE